MRLSKRQKEFIELVRAGRVQFCGFIWYPIIDGEYVLGRKHTMWALLKRDVIGIEDFRPDEVPLHGSHRMLVVEGTQKELTRAIANARHEIKGLAAA